MKEIEEKTSYYESIRHYEKQMPEALKMLRLTQRCLKDMNGQYTFEQKRDEKVQSIEVDETVVKMMKGAISGMYNELKKAGLEDIAKTHVKIHRNERVK